MSLVTIQNNNKQSCLSSLSLKIRYLFSHFLFIIKQKVKFQASVEKIFGRLEEIIQVSVEANSGGARPNWWTWWSKIWRGKQACRTDMTRAFSSQQTQNQSWLPHRATSLNISCARLGLVCFKVQASIQLWFKRAGTTMQGTYLDQRENASNCLAFPMVIKLKFKFSFFNFTKNFADEIRSFLVDTLTNVDSRIKACCFFASNNNLFFQFHC